MNTRTIFKNNLNKLIETNKMTRTELAIKIGKHKSLITYWTKGKSFPRPEEIDKICKCFDLKVYELFKTDDDNDV